MHLKRPASVGLESIPIKSVICEPVNAIEWWLMLQRCFAGRHASRFISSISKRRAEVQLQLVYQHRQSSTSYGLHEQITPLRKQLKDALKSSRGKVDVKKLEVEKARQARLEAWELTIGIEIHAQLNTSSKLFSRESRRNDSK